MPAPMPEHAFRRLVSQQGCVMKKTSKEYEILTKEGKFICNLAVSHGRGRRREVRPIYIKRFLNAIKEIKESRDAGEN